MVSCAYIELPRTAFIGLKVPGHFLESIVEVAGKSVQECAEY